MRDDSDASTVMNAVEGFVGSEIFFNFFVYRDAYDVSLPGANFNCRDKMICERAFKEGIMVSDENAVNTSFFENMRDVFKSRVSIV